LTLEIDRVMSNPDNVIMSHDLNNLFESEIVTDQTITMDDLTFVCKIKSAKLLSAQDRRWEFKLTVPALNFSDIAGIPNITYTHGDRTFSKLESLEMICEDVSKFLILVLKEIITSEEKSNE